MGPRPRTEEKAKAILAAARTCLGERGYAATTVSEVAAEAGVSRGLLHYYFRSKEDLLAQVVRANLEDALRVIGALISRASSAREIAEAITRALRTIVDDDPSFFNVMFEGWVVGRQSELVGAEVDRVFRDFRVALQEILQTSIDRGTIAPPIPTPGLAMLISALLDGIALELLTDRRLAADPKTWTAVEESILRLLASEF
jgi:AcrR family transcriptional regulator